MKNNVSFFRKLNGLTQKDLATLLGTVESNYSKKENGKVSFTIHDVMTMIEYFNCTFEDLFIKDVKELIYVSLAE
ncbi:MAG: helix-turn-helix transcriptional regulator [Paraclostridium sp.]